MCLCVCVCLCARECVYVSALPVFVSSNLWHDDSQAKKKAKRGVDIEIVSEKKAKRGRE